MSPRPSFVLDDNNSGIAETRNLFEVAALTVSGLKLADVRREGQKAVFRFQDPRAAEILASHRRGELVVNSREFVNRINGARDLAFAV